jgi:hypothetical protein
LGVTVLLGFIGLLSASNAIGQTEPQSPSALIRYLTYQSDRPDKHGMTKGQSTVFNCGPSLGEARDNRAITKSLVNLGPSAIPAIEEALDSFELRGKKSEVASEAGWLLLAYARIKGPAAYPRLRRMYANSGLTAFANTMDNSFALAFGLTSYVSASRGIPDFRCSRGEEPRDALDRLILAWERDDRVSLEASLGPRAKSVLDQLLKGRAWATMRTELWPTTFGRSVGMGYRFAASGRWAEPEETLEEERGQGAIDGNSNNPEIETLFKSSSGGDCGKLRLRFFGTQRSATEDWGVERYSIDNPGLADVLRLIASCATDTVRPR